MPFQIFSFNKKAKSTTPGRPRGGLLVWTTWPEHDVLASVLAAWHADEPIALFNPTICALPEMQKQMRQLGLAARSDGRSWSAGPGAPILAGLPRGFHAVLMTSGTTGAPRLVALDRTAITWNVQAVASHLGLLNGERTTVLCQVPLFHAFGLTLCFFHALLAGHRLLHSPRFAVDDLVATAAAAASQRLFLPFVPTQARALLSAPGLQHLAGATGVTVTGGDRVDASLIEALRQRLPLLHHTVGYGLTEAGPALTHTALDAPALSGGIGRPLPGVRLLSAAGHAAYFRSPGQCAALWEAGQTHWTISRNRWLPTGDVLAKSDNGSYVTMGRRLWSLKKRGETIFPVTIEAALEAKLAARLGVDCAVILASASDEELALLVEGSSSVERAAAVATAVAELPSFYRPTRIIWVDHWPRNAMGKADRSKIVGTP